MSDETMCYAISYPPHPGYGEIMVDKPQYAKDNAKAIVKAMKDGGVVHHVSVEIAKTGMLEYLNADKQA